MFREKKNLPVIIGGVLVVAILVVLVITSRSGGGKDSADVTTGINYLKTLEARDPQEVEDELKAIHQAELEAQREERMSQLENGDIDVWSLFEDYVIMGDSRAVGFEYYGFLPDDRVMAEAGATIKKIDEWLPDAVALNPSTIFLCFGINDINIGFWTTAEEYAEAMVEYVHVIEDAIPGVTVYVSSTLPTQEKAWAKAAKWKEIPEYNEVMSEYCAAEGIHFVDNSEIAAEYADLYDIDAIHLQKAFYPHWAANLMMAVYDSAVEESEAADAEEG